MKNIVSRLALFIFVAAVPLHAHEETLYQASPTEILVSFLRDLTENHKITESDLIRFQTHLANGELTNPIQEREALASSELYYPWQTFNENMEYSTISDFDLSLLQQQVAKLIASVHKEQHERETIDVEVESVFREMNFVPIPAGKFQSRFLGKEVMIDTFEIMDTPVMQYQWAKVMGSNPASFVDGESTQEVKIGLSAMDSIHPAAPRAMPDTHHGRTLETAEGKKIKMQPNHPVETITYKEIEEFIAKLNAQNDGYTYALPSLAEYEAVIAQALDDTWLYGSDADLQHYVVRGATTQTAIAGKQLIIDGKRIGGVLGNVWEVTREQIEGNSIVFGGGFDSAKLPISLMHVTRLFDQKIMKDNVVGFRLVRSKESANAQHYYVDWLKQHVEEWAKIWVDDPRDFVDMQKQLKFMWEHTEDYSGPVRVTLDELHKKAVTYSDLMQLKDVFPCCDTKVTDITALAALINLKKLHLIYMWISDVSALAGLIQLKYVSLRDTPISDISPLGSLKQLEFLDLEGTQVFDISSLATLTQLRKLRLYASKVTSEQVEFLQQKLPHCFITFEDDEA